MKKPLIILLLLPMLACQPSYQRLQAFDLSQELKNGLVILVLDRHADEAKTFAAYGYHRRAERLTRIDERQAEMMGQGLEKFTFCPAKWVWADALGLDASLSSGKTPILIMEVEKQTVSHGEHSQTEFVFVLRHRDGEPVPAAFPHAQTIGASLTQSSVNFAMSSLSKRMQKTWQQGLKAKGKAAEGNLR